MGNHYEDHYIGLDNGRKAALIETAMASVIVK
jgi:hypothetical protein